MSKNANTNKVRLGDKMKNMTDTNLLLTITIVVFFLFPVTNSEDKYAKMSETVKNRGKIWERTLYSSHRLFQRITTSSHLRGRTMEEIHYVSVKTAGNLCHLN